MFKKILTAVFCVLISCAGAFAQDKADDLLLKIKCHRAAMYDSLELTQEQMEQINELDKKLYDEIEPDLKKLAFLTKKLENIANSEDCTKEAVDDVKKEFKSVENDMNSIKKGYEKEFRALLSVKQKSKYLSARKQKRAELKKEMRKLRENQKEETKKTP